MDVQFITITSHEKLSNFAATAAVFPHAWSMLYKRMKRQTPELQYLLMIEKHKKNDRMHAHFLTNCACSKSWFKKNARQCGLGYQADARKVENDGAAAAYVSKYLAKSLGGDKLPSNFRRVRCSQNWATLAQLEDNEQSGNFDWLVCNTHQSLWAACEECQKNRTMMVDGSTGEYFDYGEAIDTWYH